ncbi:hypothetical protein PINS_up007014 [Pythium insidiosum]|nr:hypothetical protein PINS_up007014 [Pythium insidiosum]
MPLICLGCDGDGWLVGLGVYLSMATCLSPSSDGTTHTSVVAELKHANPDADPQTAYHLVGHVLCLV